MTEQPVLERLTRELSILVAIGRSIAAELDYATVLQSVVEQAAAALGAEAGTLWLAGKDGTLLPAVVFGGNPESLKGICVAPGEGLVGLTVAQREPIIVADCRTDPRWSQRIQAATGFTVRSMVCVPLVARGETLGALQVMNKQEGQLFSDPDLQLLSSIAAHAALLIDNSRLLHEARSLYQGLVDAIAAAIDARDPYTAGHSLRVSQLAVKIGKILGFSPARCEQLRIAALLHDVGKIGVSDEILLKQAGLSGEEWQMMMSHTLIGARILEHIEPGHLIEEAVLVARQHHERFDGQGYPDRLPGQAISLFARIVSIADTYDAMTTDRPYRKGLSHEEALREIARGAGQQHDPALVEAFRQAIAEREPVK